MPWEILEKLQSVADVKAPLRRRVTDEPFREYSEREVDALIDQYLKLANARAIPALLGGGIASSFEQIRTLRDAKLNVGILDHQSSQLQNHISGWIQSVRSLLLESELEVEALNARVSEEEIRLSEAYTGAHFNSFVKENDAPSLEPIFIVDPKTGFSFNPSQKVEVYAGAGIALSKAITNRVDIKNVHIVGEESTSADMLIYANSPRNLLLSESTFRYAILLAHETTAYLTLLLDLGSLRVFNALKLRPLGSRPISVEALRYLNESGEEIETTSEDLDISSNILFLLTPIRARYVKIVLRQDAPVTRGRFVLGDPQQIELRNSLEEFGFTLLPTVQTEEVEGAVYDFSMYNIELLLNSYQSLGHFESKPINVTALQGLALDYVGSSIDTNTEYGVERFLSDQQVFAEAYVGITLLNASDQQTLRALVPVPENNVLQVEALPLVARDGIVRFFPDLDWESLPFSVYQETTLLTLGEDYLISLDSGSTWIDELPTGAALATLYESAAAWQFRVRILDNDLSKIYWIEYKHYSNQSLEGSKTITLQQNKVVLSKQSKGMLRTSFILRADTKDIYSTPIVQYYVLKMVENL